MKQFRSAAMSRNPLSNPETYAQGVKGSQKVDNRDEVKNQLDCPTGVCLGSAGRLRQSERLIQKRGAVELLSGGFHAVRPHLLIQTPQDE